MPACRIFSSWVDGAPVHRLKENNEREREQKKLISIQKKGKDEPEGVFLFDVMVKLF